MIRPLEDLAIAAGAPSPLLRNHCCTSSKVALHRIFTVKGELLEGSRVKTVAAADGCKQGIEMSFGRYPRVKASNT